MASLLNSNIITRPTYTTTTSTYSTSSPITWTTTLNTNYHWKEVEDTYVSSAREMIDIKREVKDLRKRVANLTTLITTLIGEKQMEEFEAKFNKK